MSRSLTQAEQKKISFNEEELRIVSDLPVVNNDQANVSDENVTHVGTEIYSRLGIVSKIFRFNFDVEEMMRRYNDQLPGNVVFRVVLRRIISHLLTVAVETLSHENMLFRIFFDAFPEREFTTPTVTQEDLTVDRLFEKLNEHLQSNDTIQAEGTWRGNMVVMRVVMDKRKRRRRQLNVLDGDGDVILEGQGKFEKYQNNLGLVKIDVDESCLGHAVLLSMSVQNKSDLYKAFLAGFDRYLEKVVKSQLIEIENSCLIKSRFDDVKKYSMSQLSSKYLFDKKFDLLVYSKKNGEVVKIFENQRNAGFGKINLYHNDNHFDLIENLGLFLYGRKVDFCDKCSSKIRDYNNHICYSEFSCYKCKQFHLKNKDFLNHVICPLCNVSFDSEFCLKSHYMNEIEIGFRNFEGKQKMSSCRIFKFCHKCCSYVRRFYYTNAKGKKRMHDCEFVYCKICEKKRKKFHNCFLSFEDKNNKFFTRNCDEKMNVYIYDFETEASPDEIGVFKPYYASVFKFCNVCMNDLARKLEYGCCEIDPWYFFEGKDTDILFGNFFLEIANQNVKSKWFAHNGSRFNSLFLLRFLVCEKNVIPDVVMNGLKVLKINYKNADVLDSMLLCPSSLKKVVEMLDLGKNVKKGFYPYNFTDLTYEGQIPDKKFFSVEKMNEKELNEFDHWYEEKRKSKYILKNEVKEYCMNDVDILCKSLIKFHEIILKHTKIEVLFDPTIVTISSLALKTFKKTTNLNDMLGVEPPCGYNSGKSLKPQSKIAIVWLNEIYAKMIDKTKFRWIFHPLGEKKIDNFYVDGYDESNDIVYEFFGCYFHGCSDCFDLRSFNYKCKKTFGKLNAETSSRLNYLKHRCSNVIVMKECKYSQQLKESDKTFIEKMPLRIRDSLYGGRTSPSVLFKDCSNGGKIHYIDFVSLYPSIQFEEYFPVGDHTIINDSDDILKFIEEEMKKNEESEKKCGFVKCKILPPNDIFFPVLPTRLDDKLMFLLCQECGKLKNHNKECNHLEEKRMLFGMWCLHEIYEALKQGYEIKKSHELIYYEKKTKIFQEFISKFFVLKTQYSGVKTGLDRSELSDYLLSHFGVYVNPADIPMERNEAMRYVMKLILNSLWGKLCQNSNKSSVHFVENAEELASYLYDEKYKNVYFDVLNSHVARVICDFKEEHNHKTNKICVSVGSYITCYSRLKLLKALSKLPQESVLYYDTDSIIYYSEFCDEIIEVGDRLGEMNSELNHDEHITSFVSTGPKSYSFVTNKNKEITHVKGFKLIKSNKSCVDPNFLYEIIENNESIFQIKNSDKFKIKKDLHIFKSEELKTLKFTFDKRKILSDLSTVPWGYKI